MTRRFWIGVRARRAGRGAGDGRPSLRPAHAAEPHGISNWLQFALATPVVLWAGWPFFVRGWQSLRHPQPQHVHPDRHGHGRRLALQRRRRRSLPGLFPPAFRGADGIGRGLFRGGRGHHRAGAARPGAGAARPRADRRRHPGAARPGAARRRGASSDDGTDEEVALDADRGRRPPARPARREGAGRRRASIEGRSRRSTNRWSPANPCRSPRSRAPR